MRLTSYFLTTFILLILSLATSTSTSAQIGLGAKAPKGAEILFDGSRKMLDAKWTYWKGPRLSAELPIKWQIVNDPVDGDSVLNSKDPA